ncbi:hypothetical protein F4604DRAFT_1690403 [Suillus subluteus]|nr:hypothetical protein F4604DRAFT_1690403 [Suillus subluteus]
MAARSCAQMQRKTCKWGDVAVQAEAAIRAEALAEEAESASKNDSTKTESYQISTAAITVQQTLFSNVRLEVDSEGGCFDFGGNIDNLLQMRDTKCHILTEDTGIMEHIEASVPHFSQVHQRLVELGLHFAKSNASLGREESDIPKPSIHKTSRGMVVMPDGEVEGSEPVKLHNPYEDNIVCLGACRTQYAEPRNGLWVQIVREEGDGENEAPKKSNTKHGKKGKGPLDELPVNYWYLEELMGTITICNRILSSSKDSLRLIRRSPYEDLYAFRERSEFTFPENACDVLNTPACEAEPSDMVAGKVGTSALASCACG